MHLNKVELIIDMIIDLPRQTFKTYLKYYCCVTMNFVNKYCVIFVPDYCLNIATEAKIDLKNVNSCLPEENIVTAETWHQILCDDAHT